MFEPIELPVRARRHRDIIAKAAMPIAANPDQMCTLKSAGVFVTLDPHAAIDNKTIPEITTNVPDAMRIAWPLQKLLSLWPDCLRANMNSSGTPRTVPPMAWHRTTQHRPSDMEYRAPK